MTRNILLCLILLVIFGSLFVTLSVAVGLVPTIIGFSLVSVAVFVEIRRAKRNAHES